MKTRESNWVCRDGTILKVKDMSDSHVANALGMVRTGWRKEYRKVLEEELEHRKLLRNAPLTKALS